MTSNFTRNWRRPELAERTIAAAARAVLSPWRWETSTRVTSYKLVPPLLTANGPPIYHNGHRVRSGPHAHACHVMPIRTRRIRVYEKGNADQRVAAGRMPDCDR